MKNILLSLITLLSFYTFQAQCNFVLVNSNTSNFTVNGTSLTPCLNQATFTVNLENVSPFYLSNLAVSINLPGGVNYIAGSATNATETNISNLNQPQFSLTDIDVSTSNNNILSFSIDIDATCQLQTFLDAGGIVKNIVTITADATNNGSSISCNINHESDVYGASVPNLAITGITNQSYSGTVGQTFTRCLTIINGGSGGLSEFTLEDTHGAGITISSVSIGTLTTSGQTEQIVLNGTSFATIGNNDNIFDPGESITICETVNVLSCTSTSSSYRYYWGCNNENCQELTDGANVVFPGEVPDLTYKIWNNYLGNANTGSTNPNSYPATNFNYTGCFDDGSQFKSRLTYINQGTGTAYNIDCYLEAGNNWGGYGHGIDTSSMIFKYNGTVYPKTLQNSIHRSYSYGSCLPSESIGVTHWIIDSIAPGDTVSLEWSYFICIDQKNCTNRMHNLHWRFTTDYENACSQNYNIVRTGGSRVVYYTSNMILDQSPGTMFDGSAGSYSFINQTTDFFIPRNTSNDLFRYKLVVPSCVSVSNFRINRPSDGAIFTPNSTSSNGDTIEFFYDNLPTPWLANTTIDFDVSLNCSSCSSGSFPINLESYYTPDVGNTCELKTGCKSTMINLVCGLACPGIQFNQYSAERINFGLPDNDNDGIPDGGGSLDFSTIRTDRLVYGDTLQITYGGNINNPADDVWSYVYAVTTLAGGGSYITPQGTSTFKIYDASTGVYHTSTSLPSITYTTNSLDRTFTQEIDYVNIAYDTPLPVNFHLSHNDSVFVISKFVATTNNAWNVHSISATSDFYVSTIQNPTNSSDKFGCPTLNQDLQLYGYNFYNGHSSSYQTKSCDQLTLYQTYYVNIGPWFSGPGKNRFPNEYRYFAHPEFLNVKLPDDYTFISAMFYCQRQRGTSSSSSYGTTHNGGSGWYNIIPDASLSTSDSLVFNTGSYFGPDLTNDSIIYPEETSYGELRVIIEPNCTVEGNVNKRIYYDWEFENTPQWDDDITRTNTNYWADTLIRRSDEYITYDKPNLLLQSNLVSQNIPGDVAIWNISITNNSNTSDAHNTWFGIPTIGTVVADSLFDVNTNTMLFPSSNGIFQTGNIGASQTLDYIVYTHINGCNSDSIIVYHGWDCSGYPVDISSYPCTPLQTTLYITPLMPELSNSITTLGSDTIGLCDTAHFEIEVRDFQLGNAYNLITTINVSTGMSIEPGSCYIKYPQSGTYVSIPDPINTTGNNYQWDISAIEATIGANGLNGVLDQTLNKYYIRFNCLTDCDYTSGSRVTTLTTGTAKCGRSFNSNVGVANQVYIGSALPPYEANIKINTTYITPCLGNTPIELQIINQGPLVFGANDSISFRLDNGISYVTNSFSPILNAPSNGTPTIFNNNGVDELSWKLPAGVAVGDTTKFSFTINGAPSDLECGVLQLGAQITTYGGAVCSTTGSFCNIDIATADTLKNIFIYKGYLDISNSSNSYSSPNAPSGETGYISFDIFNSGETISTGTETIIQYYQDTDNDGVYSTGDTYITNDTIQNQLTGNTTFNYSSIIDIPAGLGCKLIAVIDTALNPCTCTPSQILINLPLISPTTYDTICSGDVVQIGLPAINTYTYSWSSTTNIDNPSIAQPNFSPVVNYPATTDFEKIRTVNRGSCLAYDTARVHVFSNPQANTGADIDLCNTYSTILSGNQPQGTATGAWSLATNYTQPSTVTFTDATLYNTTVSSLQEGTYKLVWTVSNGTCTPATDTMLINVYDQPTANAGADIDLCNTYSTTLNGNQPQGTATGAWSLATNYTQPSTVSFANATVYNTTVSSLQEGTYKLVWTVSNGTCTPATDTVLINVYDQPTANAGSDIDLCNSYSTPLSGNQPIGTATGAWSLATNYTQPSTVTFANATVYNTTVSSLQEGTYKLVWTVSNGTCTPATDTVFINVYDQPTANAGSDIDLCNTYFTSLSGNQPQGTATGAWSLATNYTQPSTVTFTDATLYNTTVSSLQEGTYKLVWTVSNGTCTPATDTMLINVYDQPTANAGADIDLCNTYTTTLNGNQPQGTATGLWTMSPTFTQAPSTVNFTDNTVYNTTISNLQEGTYWLIWTVSNGTCSPAIDSIKINVYDQPTANAGLDLSMCNDYDTILNANQPQGTATGIWIENATFNNPSTVVFSNQTQYNTPISGLVEGSYELVWIVSNGSCTPALDTVAIEVYDQPTANAGSDLSLCNVYDTVLNGNVPQGRATGLWTIDASIVQPSVVTFADPTLYNTAISNLQEGTYSLVWTVSNGSCNDATDTVIIEVYDQPMANAGADTALCNQYSTTLNGNEPQGRASGLWTMDASISQPSTVTFTDATLYNTTISNLQEGTYSLVWTVSNGSCIDASDTITIEVYDQPTANAGNDLSLCNIYDTILNGNQPIGRASGLWTMNSSVVQPSVVTFADPTLYNTAISNLQEGTYSLIWTVSNGSCNDAKDTVIIEVYDQPTANAGADINLCNIYSTQLNGNAPQGRATGLWTMDASTPQPSVVNFVDATAYNTNINNLQEGVYTLIWTVSNGSCNDATDTVLINVFDQPTANAGGDISLCNTYTTQLSGNQPLGTATGVWTIDNSINTPSGATFTDSSLYNTNVNNLQEGTYQFIWTVSNGTCTDASDIVQVIVYDQPTANAGTDITICDQGVVTLIGNEPLGTANGQWTLNTNFTNPSNISFTSPQNDTTQASYILDGEYQFIWSVSNGICPTATDTVSVFRYPKPMANFVQLGSDICPKECIEVTNTSVALPPYNIANSIWTIDTITFTPLTLNGLNICMEQVGTYPLAIIAISSNGCSDTLIVENAFTVHPNPIAGFSMNPSSGVMELDEIAFTNQAQNASSVLYYFGDGDSSIVFNPNHTYLNDGNYPVTQVAFSDFNCTDTTIQYIVIDEKESLFIPNGFTPNGDGKNDTFKPKTRGIESEISEYHFMIFDRWGNIIFETYNTEEGWDGTFKNNDMPLGVYVWKLEYNNRLDEPIGLTGSVTLVR